MNFVGNKIGGGKKMLAQLLADSESKLQKLAAERGALFSSLLSSLLSLSLLSSLPCRLLSLLLLSSPLLVSFAYASYLGLMGCAGKSSGFGHADST